MTYTTFDAFYVLQRFLPWKHMRYPDNEKRNMHGSCCCPLSVPNIVGETHRGGHRRLDFYIIYCRSFSSIFLIVRIQPRTSFFFFCGYQLLSSQRYTILGEIKLELIMKFVEFPPPRSPGFLDRIAGLSSKPVISTKFSPLMENNDHLNCEYIQCPFRHQ